MKYILLLLLTWLGSTVSAGGQTFRWMRANNNIGQISEVTGLSCGNGTVTATGGFAGNLSFDGLTIVSTDKVLRNSLTGQWSVGGDISWLQRGGGTTATAERSIFGLATAADAAGNSYVVYAAFADAVFNQTLVQVAPNTPTFVLIKYSSSGEVLWTRTFGAWQMEFGGLSVDAAGNCWLAASFIGRTVVGSTTHVSTFISDGKIDGLLIKLTAAGAVSWSRQLTGTTGQIFSAIGADAAGNLYVAGYLNEVANPAGTLNFSPTVALTGGAGGRMFVAKYDANGTAVWARRMGGPNDMVGPNEWQQDYIRGLAADPAGTGVAVCGLFGHLPFSRGSGTATFGPTTLRAEGNFGFPDGFVTRLDAQGEFTWTQAIRGVADERVNAIVAGGQGSYYVSGQANIDTRLGNLAVTRGNGSPDGFVAKLSAAGTPQWLTSFGGDREDNALSLATDGQGRVYVGGWFTGGGDTGNAEFGPFLAVAERNQRTAFLAQLTDSQVLSSAAPRTGPPLTLDVYPNPAAGPVAVSWPAEVRATHLDVLDALGRSVRRVALASGRQQATLQLDALPRGVYVLRLSGAGAVLTRKLALD